MRADPGDRLCVRQTDAQPQFEAAALLRATRAGAPGDGTATAADGKQIVLRPFMTIKEETYSTYLRVKA